MSTIQRCRRNVFVTALLVIGGAILVAYLVIGGIQHQPEKRSRGEALLAASDILRALHINIMDSDDDDINITREWLTSVLRSSKLNMKQCRVYLAKDWQEIIHSRCEEDADTLVAVEVIRDGCESTILTGLSCMHQIQTPDLHGQADRFAMYSLGPAACD